MDNGLVVNHRVVPLELFVAHAALVRPLVRVRAHVSLDHVRVARVEAAYPAEELWVLGIAHLPDALLVVPRHYGMLGNRQRLQV